MLVRNPGRLVSQRQLLHEVWGPAVRDRDRVPAGADGPGPAQARGRPLPAPPLPDRARHGLPLRALSRAASLGSPPWSGPPSTSTTSGAWRGPPPTPRPGRRAEAEAFAGRVGPVPPGSTWAVGPGGTCPTWGPRWWPSMPRRPCWPPAGPRCPDALYVLGDVEHLPFARHSHRRGLVVDDPPPRPPGPAAPGPVGPAPGPGRGQPPSSIQVLEGCLRGRRPTRRRGRGAVLRRLGARPAGGRGDRGRVRGRGGLAGRLRRRAGPAGRAGPHPGRHGRRRHAPAGLRRQPLAVLGRRRRRATPAPATASGRRPWPPASWPRGPRPASMPWWTTAWA